MSGLIKFMIAALLLVGIAEAQHPIPPSTVLRDTRGLAQIFFSSRLMSQDPMLAMACFSDYIAHSNANGDKYGNDYNKCLTNATESRRLVDESMNSERSSLVVASEQVCDRLRACNNMTTNLKMFQCHGTEVSF